MGFSIWEYFRERARNATLAGIQDALDIAEDADFEAGQKAAADRLTARLGGQVVKQLPEPEGVAAGPRAPEPGASGPEAGGATFPPPARGRAFGEGLDTAQAGPRAPAPTPDPGGGPDPFAERLAAPLPPRPEPQDRRGPARNGRPDGRAPALPESGPSPAARPETPERRKPGRPRKDQGG